MNELREARKAAGLTQVQLSKRAGVDQQTISYHECHGKRRPHMLTALKIALALGVDVADLFPSPNGEPSAPPVAAVERAATTT